MTPHKGHVRAVDALILGTSVNLIELIHALALAGIHSRVVPVPGEPASRSRHATVIAARDWPDPYLRGEEEFLAWLVAYGRRQPEKLPLLFTSDEALRFVSHNRDVLAQAYEFVLPSHSLVLDCTDKGRFTELARRLDLPVPPTRVVNAEPGSPTPEVDDLGMPLILKPERRDRVWHRGLGSRAKALRIETPEELAALWPTISAMKQTVLVQRAIPGRHDRVESYHVYAGDDGQIRGEFTGRKIRTWPLQYGPTTSLAITDAEDVRLVGREIVAKLGLVGVAKLDFKRDDDGRLYLLEVNPRCHLWHHPGARAGVNIPALVHADLVGLPRPATADRPAPVTWFHPNDLTAAREDGVGIVDWLRWARRCEVMAFWSWDDPLPLIAAVLRGRQQA